MGFKSPQFPSLSLFTDSESLELKEARHLKEGPIYFAENLCCNLSPHVPQRLYSFLPWWWYIREKNDFMFCLLLYTDTVSPKFSIMTWMLSAPQSPTVSVHISTSSSNESGVHEIRIETSLKAQMKVTWEMWFKYLLSSLIPTLPSLPTHTCGLMNS